MGASSVTGTGVGASNKYTQRDLAILANGPSILITGRALVEGNLSPPSNTGSVTFNTPLDGNSDNYVVMVTSINGGGAYIIDFDNNDDDNFSGFSFGVDSEEETEVMYMVAKIGVKAKILN